MLFFERFHSVTPCDRVHRALRKQMKGLGFL